MEYWILVYVGPETILPVASCLAAAIGVLLMFWRFVIRCITGCVRWVFRIKSDDVEPAGSRSE
jgi:hypothetical protein